MHAVLCFYVYTGLSLPVGNFIQTFAAWRVGCLTATKQAASTAGVLWSSILKLSGSPVIRHQLALNSDFLVFLSRFFAQARQGDLVRGFTPGFNLHLRLARFLDRQAFLQALVVAMTAECNRLFSGGKPESAGVENEPDPGKNYGVF